MAILEPRTRIQRKNHEAILEAALDVFSRQGFSAATLDKIAKAAGMSKPNLLYYFPSKEAVFDVLMDSLLESWLAPLKALRADCEDPVEEILEYVRRKLQMSVAMPRESRLFAHEILDGAPRTETVLASDLRPLVDEKAKIITNWVEQGRLAPVDPYHLIFSIWAQTQHYADFDVQVRAVLGENRDPFKEAKAHLEQSFRRTLTP